ncbi:MAG: hypothetical protein QOC99_1141 [Acidobacteriota bacterium]|jgi:hypothetical protein|nr:hypothetical protein [Acidobacteriota bacterium]
MSTLHSTKQTAINLCLLVAVLLCASSQISAQIRLGGITIPKPKRPDKPSASQPERTTPNKTDAGTAGENSAGAQEDALTNPNAPADYNANLNVGDQAVAVDRFRDVDVVRIVGKSGAAYKVAKLTSPNDAQWYSANSVYPYFDYRAFTEIMFDYKHYVTPYLPCYGKKHNLASDKVTVEGYNAFGARHFDNGQNAQRTLQAEQPKLAELDGLLKSKLGGVAPNTFLEYLSNPAIVAEIVSQRAEYLKCAVGVEDEKPDFRLAVFLSDIKKAQDEAARYTPADFLYLVSAGDASDELLRAVSRRAREEWAQQWLKNPASRAEFDAEWDKLAAIAAKKIPTYKPSAASYRFRDPVGERLLMGALKNPATLKIFRIGTDTAGWNIEKGNNDILPSYRYKTMKVYFRDPNDDHPYCRVVSARIKQDYAGGGRYNSEVYRSSVSEEIFGCP